MRRNGHREPRTPRSGVDPASKFGSLGPQLRPLVGVNRMVVEETAAVEALGEQSVQTSRHATRPIVHWERDL